MDERIDENLVNDALENTSADQKPEEGDFVNEKFSKDSVVDSTANEAQNEGDKAENSSQNNNDLTVSPQKDEQTTQNSENAKKDAKAKKRADDIVISAKMIGVGMLSKLKESVFSVVPVAIIVLILCLTPVVDVAGREIAIFAVSTIFLVLGISLFNLGADLAMTPMGEQIGSGLTKSRNLPLLLIVGAVMGVLITIAEPDLSVLGDLVSEVMNKTVLLVVVGVGVGLFLLLAILRIVFKKSISLILVFFYMVIFSVAAILIENGGSKFIPLAFDSGGVTTGPITVPFIMALGVGVAATIGGKYAKENSFGLIALCSIGPVLAVLVLSFFMEGDSFKLPDYSIGEDLGAEFVAILGKTALDVFISLGLIVAFFLILQFTVLKLPRRRLTQILIGIVYTYVGLLIFFISVHLGFMPIGFKLGQALANYNEALVVVVAFILGFVVVLAEPAVHVLKAQVEQITDGAVSKGSMLIALSIGVGLSIGLSLIRIVVGFSLLYYIIPGYIISLGLAMFVPKLYTSIAFDSGGVASGPLTASFILPFATGACCAIAGDSEVLDLAFGIVAMVAMTPLITIQFLGFRAIAAKKMRHKMNIKRIVRADDEQIIEFM